MKRVLIVALVATAMLIAFAAPAFGNDIQYYRLTITAYWDADGDGCWDCNEVVLPGLQGAVSTSDGVTVNYGTWKTDACGWWKERYIPAGVEVRVSAPEKFSPMMGDPNYVRPGRLTEVTPAWSANPEIARFFMTRNRCVLFGVAPY